MRRVWALLVVLLLLLLVYVIGLRFQIRTLTDERDRYKTDTETLLADCRMYRVRDSLSAARVGSLELTLKEYKRYRTDDLALIRELTARNRDLQDINRVQAQTIVTLGAVPLDTVVLVDSVPIPARSVHCGDAWYDFDGLVTEDSFSGTMVSRDSLVLTETVRYRRFLWWRTRKIRDRRLDAVSLNPHTVITGLEYVRIVK